MDGEAPLAFESQTRRRKRRHHPLTREWVTTSHASVSVATKFVLCAIDRYSDGMYLDDGGDGRGGLRSHVSSTPPVQTHLSAHARPSPPLTSSESHRARCPPAPWGWLIRPRHRLHVHERAKRGPARSRRRSRTDADCTNGSARPCASSPPNTLACRPQISSTILASG